MKQGRCATPADVDMKGGMSAAAEAAEARFAAGTIRAVSRRPRPRLNPAELRIKLPKVKGETVAGGNYNEHQREKRERLQWGLKSHAWEGCALHGVNNRGATVGCGDVKARAQGKLGSRIALDSGESHEEAEASSTPTTDPR